MRDPLASSLRQCGLLLDLECHSRVSFVCDGNPLSAVADGVTGGNCKCATGLVVPAQGEVPMREKGRPDDDIRDYVHALAPLRITEREAEVARLVAWHFDNAEIANELGISVSTAKTHVAHILFKLGIENRGTLAGEVRLIIEAFRAERDRKKQAALLVLKRGKSHKGARLHPRDAENMRDQA